VGFDGGGDAKALAAFAAMRKVELMLIKGGRDAPCRRRMDTT